MSPTWIRWMLAALVVVLLGGAIVGVDLGAGGGSDEPAATTAADGGQAVRRLGAVADTGRSSFQDTGCGGCHRLADAGTAGTIGPDLDEVLPGSTLADIREDILDPEAASTPGYPSGRMPDGYDRLPADQLDALVRYLQAATSGR